MTLYNGTRILVTGHTGFKGSWLVTWLKSKGASVSGLALSPEGGPTSLFAEARVANGMTSIIGDIGQYQTVLDAYTQVRPEIVFHLAAQPLVRRSYRNPIETYQTNVVGTANIFEAARHCTSVKAIVCVTTDKVYDNKEWNWGYREIDRLGGKDPYSASKACAELVAASYAQTIFSMDRRVRIATARGGNVVGGGDWSEDRLFPDIIRAIKAQEPITLRNTGAVRPWQHVLELVSGYSLLGERLLAGDVAAEGAWNFGPERESEVSVERLVKTALDIWGDHDCTINIQSQALQEAQLLRLDISKAAQELRWRPALNFSETIAMTVDWYRRHHKGEDAAELVSEQIAKYQTIRSQRCP